MRYARRTVTSDLLPAVSTTVPRSDTCPPAAGPCTVTAPSRTGRAVQVRPSSYETATARDLSPRPAAGPWTVTGTRSGWPPLTVPSMRTVGAKRTTEAGRRVVAPARVAPERNHQVAVTLDEVRVTAAGWVAEATSL